MEDEKKEIIEVEKVENKENSNTDTQTKVETNVTPEPKKERKGFCIAAMVLGIVALVFLCVWYISIPCAILAVIFGILGIKTANKGMAIAGLVTGSIGLVLWVLCIILIFVFGFAIGFSGALDELDNYNYRTDSSYDFFD